MSENAFQIAPIFYIPIDLEENINLKEDSNDYNISEDEENYFSEERKEEAKDKNIITFSLNSNDPEIKSMTNSSKIYISEIFKKNSKKVRKKIIIKSNKNDNNEFDINDYCINNNGNIKINKLINIGENNSINNIAFINNNFNNMNSFVNYLNIYDNTNIINNKYYIKLNISNNTINRNNDNHITGLFDLSQKI